MALKENIRVAGKQDIQTKVMTTLFALLAEVECELISEQPEPVVLTDQDGAPGCGRRSRLSSGAGSLRNPDDLERRIRRKLNTESGMLNAGSTCPAGRP